MTEVIRTAVGSIAKCILSLRYRVRLRGLDKARGTKGALILPNHPGYTDPALVLSHLWAELKPRPMVLASMFDNPLMFWIPRALGALEIPDLTVHSTEARQETEASIEAIVNGLRHGDNFVLWPAGRIQRQGKEVLGSTRSVAEILARVPETKLILLRTRGLRGSMFSYARTAAAPNLVFGLLKSLLILFANLGIFAPRRKIEMTLECVDRSDMPEATREALNPFLEEWYNRPASESERSGTNPNEGDAAISEPAVHVPYHFAFGKRAFDFPTVTALAKSSFDDIDAGTREAIAEVLSDKLGGTLPSEFSRPDSSLDSLGFDSLDRMEISLEVEERFGFRGNEVPETIGDLWELAAGIAGASIELRAPPAWTCSKVGSAPAVIEGSTILEALVRRAVANPGQIVAADDLSGAVTYANFLVGVQAFAREFDKRIPSENIGILLPASVATDLVIFAVHLSGKTPVLLNWTTGPSNLAHAATTMQLSHIVSSQRFVDRMAIEIDGTEFLFLEDIKKSLSKASLAWLAIKTRLRPRRLLRRLPTTSADEPAVVLFTSGSEKAPKAVPLTHTNILSNLRGVLDGYDLHRNDIFLGFLPPFHSFGFTLTVMLPILSGCRVVHHPDPTDAAALGRKLHAYSATILGATPTFLSYILKRSQPEDLATLRWAIVGGEKCPDLLFEEFAQAIPDGELLEGYGVTECSPLVCCTLPAVSNQRGAMGRPIPGVEIDLVDPDSYGPIQPDAVGMLLVAGLSVFPGYINYDGPSPFHDRKGKRWYITGDLATRDEDGTLHFRGRLKRFLKAGGEMVSLPAIEAPLAMRFPPTDEGPRIAVEGIDDPARRIVLFAVEDVELRQANAILTEAGLRGVMRLDEVQIIDAIPLLGTGKIDYKVLRKRLQT